MSENARPGGVFHIPGFAPKQISTLVNREIVQEHAENAAALWRMHDHAVRAPLYRLRDLALLDARIVAHLDGLRTAGDDGLQLARRGLAAEDPGAVFVAAYAAFGASNRDAMNHLVQVGASVPGFERALVAALSWLDLPLIQEPLRLLARANDARYRRMAVAVTAAHRVRSEQGFEACATDPDPALRARTLRAIGETKCPHLEATLAHGTQAAEPSCRFWAFWSMALFGDESAAVEAFNIGVRSPALLRTAIEIGMRLSDPRWAREQVRSLARNAASMRQGIVAAGAFGDPAAVPWLLESLKNPELARVSAEAIGTITGLDLERAELKSDAPEDLPDENENDRDLRWPSYHGFAEWWQSERHRFTEGERYLAGRLIRDNELLDVLRTGYQRQRRAAALEIARLRPEASVFPTAARADWQRRRLAS